MKNTKILIFAIVLTIIAGSNLFAQKDTTGAREKLRKVLKEKLIDKVGLSEATADKVMEITAEHRKEIKALKKQIKTLKKEIYDNPKSSDVGTKLDELAALQEKTHKSRTDLQTKMRSVLTPTQIAETMAFQKEVKKFMKKEVKKTKKTKKDREDREDGSR
ncbi:MAG: hypothetical protein WC139_06350 [Candidatus Kapaibacterium sp.]